MTAAEKALLQRLSRRAAGLTPDLARRQMAAYNIIRSALSERELSAAIRGGSVEKLISELLSDRTLNPAMSSLKGLVDRSVMDAGAKAMRDLPGRAASVTFDQLNPRVLDAARRLDTKVINSLKTEIRDTVRQRVEAGLRAGQSSATIARDLRSVIGLAPNQEKAVSNFRRMLEAGDREALTRSMRNRSFDRTLQKALGANGTGLRTDQVDRMVNAYRTRMIAMNAATHAQTASRDAQKIGQRLAVDDAIEKGMLDPDRLIKVWVAVGDDRVRPEHAEMDGEEVRYNETFSNGDDTPGESDYNCRCIARYTQASTPSEARRRVSLSKDITESAVRSLDNLDDGVIGAKPFEGIRPGETKEEFQRRRRRERAIARREKRKIIKPDPTPPPPPPPPTPGLRSTQQALDELEKNVPAIDPVLAGGKTDVAQTGNFFTQGGEVTRRTFDEINAKFGPMFADAKVAEIELDSSRLFSPQPTISKDIIAKYVRDGVGDVLPAVVEKNGVYYVIDGNHRLASRMLLGQQRAAVRLVKLPDDRSLSEMLKAVEEHGRMRVRQTLGSYLDEAVNSGRISQAEVNDIEYRLAKRWDFEKVVREIGFESGIGPFGGGKLNGSTDDFVALVRRKVSAPSPNWRAAVPVPKPTPVIVPPKPTPPTPTPGVDPKLRRIGETEEEFQKRRRKERAAARRAKARGEVAPKPGPAPEPTPKVEPPRQRPSMQEINREFDRITVETSREVNRLSGEAFDLRQKVRVLQERLKAWTQSQLPGVRYWEQPHYHALSDEISNLGKREADLSTKISRLRSEAARKQLDFLSVPKKEQATFTANVAIKKKGVAEPAREGVSLFRAMVPKKYLPPNRYNDGTLIGEKTVTVRHTKSRGFYRANEAYTSGAGAHARETVVHELGHWLEEKSDEVRRAAEEFLYNRTKGNAVTKFGGNYGPDEIYRPDKFYHDYVGKMYGEVTNFDSPDGWGPGGKFRPKWRYRATEIFSMGLEAMARNPAKFLQDDPGHFELILKLIYGEL